jgi:[protein-PII] uridylyltransferase
MGYRKPNVRPSPLQLQQFVETLPDAYRANFSWPTIREHATLCAARVPGQAGVGVCSAPRLPGTALCVVADDRPGLLAVISAALLREQLDVIGAEAYTRILPKNRREALDVFWVQRVGADDPRRPLTTGEIQRVEQTLSNMLAEQLLPATRPPTVPPLKAGSTVQANVRFVEDKEGQLSWLEVETDDRGGLLLTLSRALYEQKVQIVSSHVRTNAGRVSDKFAITELNDTPINNDRRRQIQVAVLSAVQKIMGG